MINRVTLAFIGEFGMMLRNVGKTSQAARLAKIA